VFLSSPVETMYHVNNGAVVNEVKKIPIHPNCDPARGY
ncbi:hypothetical protein A2U01_0062692, partial [Trifolium medium]|nr:hypothetical protein [Trifolium medium]